MSAKTETRINSRRRQARRRRRWPGRAADTTATRSKTILSRCLWSRTAVAVLAVVAVSAARLHMVGAATVEEIFEAEDRFIALAEGADVENTTTAEDQPTHSPSEPIWPTDAPTKFVSTESPSPIPTDPPTSAPTLPPTAAPVPLPTAEPTILPTEPPVPQPTDAPSTSQPTDAPVPAPTEPPTTPAPTESLTKMPTAPPSSMATPGPTARPTGMPSGKPTNLLSAQTSDTTSPTDPSAAPTPFPSSAPTTDNRQGSTTEPAPTPTRPPRNPVPTDAPSIKTELTGDKSGNDGGGDGIDGEGIGPPVGEQQTTLPPSPEPTDGPTPSPSDTVTDQPTDPPTEQPTDLPTDQPTFDPTVVPTPTPSSPSTSSPTLPPTSEPTTDNRQGTTTEPATRPPRGPAPTDAPSTGIGVTEETDPPTEMPSKPPTNPPTRPPTKMPTPGPTSPPTGVPTPQPTPRPSPTGTQEPTDVPTAAPTVSPTISNAPTASPTPRPTGDPTASPTDMPTNTPTDQPSPAPSASPSNAPSLPLQRHLIEGVVMTLLPYTRQNVLVGQSIIEWEEVTRAHVRRNILDDEMGATLFDLEVFVNINFQNIPTPVVVSGSTRGRRRLQETEIPASARRLSIDFNVLLRYRSADSDIDNNALVYNAWDTSEERANYIKWLQDTDSMNVFNEIEDTEVRIDGFEPPANSKESDNGGGSGIDLAVIIGAAVGGAALVFLIIFIFFKCRGSKKKEKKEIRDVPPEQEAPPRIAVSTEILVEPQDDISTLGDPTFTTGGMLMNHLEKDENTASVGDDYDYTRQYRGGRNPPSVGNNGSRDRFTSEEYTKGSSANSATFSKLGHMGESLFADDSSFEQQFAEPQDRIDVVAPAGKLGMVIDTPNGGPPVVHAIKDTSVLADRVKVGDRLISVDGEDCTSMTAMQVSKLISLKSEKPARVLAFMRTRASSDAVAQ